VVGAGHREKRFSTIALVATIKCPACGDEHIRPCIRVDEGGRELIDNSCETCGHKLSLEEISRYVVN